MKASGAKKWRNFRLRHCERLRLSFSVGAETFLALAKKGDEAIYKLKTAIVLNRKTETSEPSVA